MNHSSYAARRNALLRRIPYITWPTPTIESISPLTVIGGIGTITVRGTGYRVALHPGGGVEAYADNVFAIYFGETLSLGFTVISDTEMTVQAPFVTAPLSSYLLIVKSLGGDAVAPSENIIVDGFTGQLGIPRSRPGNIELGVP